MNIHSAEWQRVAVLPQKNTVTLEAHGLASREPSPSDTSVQSVRLSKDVVVSDALSKEVLKRQTLTACEARFHDSGDRITVSLRPASQAFLADQAKLLRAFLSEKPIPPGTHYVDADDFQRGKPTWIASHAFDYAAEFCASIQDRPAILSDRWIAVASGPALADKTKTHFPDWDASAPQGAKPLVVKGKRPKKKLRNKGFTQHEFQNWPLKMSVYHGYFQDITLHRSKVAYGMLKSLSVDGKHVKVEGKPREEVFPTTYRRTRISKPLAKETRNVMALFGDFERNRDNISENSKKLVVA